MKRNLTISLFAGVFLSAAALFLAFRNVPISELLHYFGSIDYFWIIPSIGLALFSFILRVYRWQIILGSAKKIGFWRAFHPLMIGFAVNCILPGRLGEMVRPVVLKKRDNVPMTTGLATVLTERVFDIGLLVVLFAVVLSTVQIRSDLHIEFGPYRLNRGILEAISDGMMKLCFLLAVGVLAVSFSGTREIINRLIARMPDLFFFLNRDWQEKIRRFLSKPLIRIVENVAEGFSLVRYPKKMILCLGLSVMVWYSAAVSVYLMTLGCPGVRGLSFLESTAMLIIICFFIALPSVPGFWGLWEAGGVFALSLFGISSQDAAGFTLANHAIQMIPVILVGMVSAVITGINILKVAYEPDVT
jgi:uncharacterized protein (TIRG00374 family)